jgi:tRNA (adenine37-N6)-methyltransferase
MESIPHIKPIGIIYTPFREADQPPIQPHLGESIQGQIELDPEYADGLMDLDGFERIWLLYWFDRSTVFKLHVQPYRDKQVHGVFATRAPSRPNPLGLSCVRLDRIEGHILHISGVDILDGTPLLDIKPYIPEFDAFPGIRAGWMDKADRQINKADDRFYQNHPKDDL